MKFLLKLLLTVSLIFGFISCTDNTDEIIQQQEEKHEILGIDKEDITAPGGGGDDPDYNED